MEPAALLKPSGKNVASVNHFCAEKKILLEPVSFLRQEARMQARTGYGPPNIIP